ncbi:MAG: hypothetical protein HRU36_03195 [Rickettsiales bacterium]|nr:hypothetical protein [Rickettsiales bacterium]
MFKTIKKLATATTFVVLLSTSSVFAEETVPLNSNIMFTSGVALNKLLDMHMGTVTGLNTNTATTHTGYLTLDTAHNIAKGDLSSVTHNGEGTSGKVRVSADAGQTLALWITQPQSSSCGINTSWSNPTCKVLRSDDGTADQAEAGCALGDNLLVTVTDPTSYLYIGGTLHFNDAHTCHTGADAADAVDNATGTHTLHVAQQ